MGKTGLVIVIPPRKKCKCEQVDPMPAGVAYGLIIFTLVVIVILRWLTKKGII